MDALELAILFHVIYERKSAEFDYITRTETRIFDPESKNGKLMISTCEEVLECLKENKEGEKCLVTFDDGKTVILDKDAVVEYQKNYKEVIFKSIEPYPAYSKKENGV
jgi:hypothetical protein